MHDSNNTPATGENKGVEQTRVMPPVDTSAEGTTRVRRRRSDRYDDQPAEKPTTVVQPVQDSAAGTTRVQPRYQAPQGSQQDVPRPSVLSRTNQQPQENGVRRPLNVPGYSPRQPLGTGPVQAQPRQAMPAQDGSARRPAPQYPSGRVTPVKQEKKRGGWLIPVVAVLLVLGLLIMGFLMIDENGDSALAGAKRSVVNLLGGSAGKQDAPPPAQASGFTAAINTGTAPLVVTFNLTTSKSVSQVRLADEDGNALATTSAAITENADSIIWMINLAVNDGYEGAVQAQIFDGAAWLNTGLMQSLEIAMPAPTASIAVDTFNEVTEAPATEVPVTDAPVTEAPVTLAPTATPTLAPTATPTLEPTATPTLEPTATPTLEPTATPTLEPTATPTAEPVPATQVPVVTEAPTATPTLEPTATPTAEPTATPEPTPTPAPTAAMVALAAENADPALIADTVIYEQKTKVDEYVREQPLNMPAADAYTTLPFGVMTFRGNAFRQNAAVGDVDDGISSMELLWSAEAGSVKGSSSTYYGIGWTGQPAIIKWSKEIREATNIVDEKRSTAALKEVIVAGLDGHIYFLDLADGQPTREDIDVGYPMRGTPSLHPLGYPVMTVGQYARKMASGTGDIGLRFYNLLTQRQVYWIDGLDGDDDRPYYAVGAFDTSALIDPTSDTLVTIGTNGMLYTSDLETEYDVRKGEIKISPTFVSMKSRTKDQANKYVAVEASPAMYGSYVFYADMDGILRCVDTTTMTTAWAVDTGDQVQAAIALDKDAEGNVWLYTANTLENRSKGSCSIRRFNAATGEESWTVDVSVVKNAVKKNKTPGAMASPVIGQHALSDLVYFTLTNVSKAGAESIADSYDSALAGVIVAMDKASGEIVWSQELDSYAYASPVAVYAADGQGWIIQPSASGTLYLLDGLTGDLVSTLELEGTIEGSPAVYNDTLVIGTTGKNTSFIYGVKLQ